MAYMYFKSFLVKCFDFFVTTLIANTALCVDNVQNKVYKINHHGLKRENVGQWWMFQGKNKLHKITYCLL